MNSTDSPQDILAYVPDLMDWSKLSSIEGLIRVKNLTDAEITQAAKLLVDLDKVEPEELSELFGSSSTTGAVKVGFCSHVNQEHRELAQSLGFEVLARSKFFGNPAQFVC